MRTQLFALAAFTFILSLLVPPRQLDAQQAATPTATSSTVPRLIAFSGVVKDTNGHPLRGIVGITFSLYEQQEGGAALWIETQNVEADTWGHYTVMLGATKPEGLPVDLFTSGQARWLGIQPSGQTEESRVLMVSAPYALKAADAETVGGLSPSAFVLVAPPVSTVVSDANTPSAVLPAAAITGSGTTDFLPLWTSASTIASSAAFQSGTGSTAKIGIATTTPASTLDVNGAGTIRGLLSLPATATATSASGKNSQPFSLTASSFKSGTGGGAVAQNFRWQAEAAGNNTTTPSGTVNLLFGAGTAAPAETGLKIASNGQITFAKGQTFPPADLILTGDAFGPASLTTVGGLQGFPVANAIPTVNQVLTFDGASWTPQVAQSTNFTGNLAGEVTGPQNVTLVSNALSTNISNAIVRRDGTGSFAATNLTLSGGLSLPNGNGFFMGGTTFISNTGTANTFVGTLAGSLGGGTGNTAVGFSALENTLNGSNNSAFGTQALVAANGSSDNSAFGAIALAANSLGSGNAAFGSHALSSNTFGVTNSAFGLFALAANATGSNNAAFGNGALAASTVDGNSAFGSQALSKNTTGTSNSSFGTNSLQDNTTGANNSAFGDLALWPNMTGANNSAFGAQAMGNNGTIPVGSNNPASNNSAFGFGALSNISTGSNNAAFGSIALSIDSSGANNSAFGNNALSHVGTGTNNIAIGNDAGSNLSTSESDDIYVGNQGVLSESNTIRIGASQTAAFIAGIAGTLVSGSAVMVSSTGQLGVLTSSQRFKEKITGMESESDVLMKLRPVSFYYKSELDASRTRQYGLVAEEVAKVAPQLVVFDRSGVPQSVRYHFVNAMLLNEVQKQKRMLDQQERTIARQQLQIQSMQREIDDQRTQAVAQSQVSDALRDLQAQNASLAHRLAQLSAEVKQIQSHQETQQVRRTVSVLPSEAN